MPRINIEDSLWSDDRFLRLIEITGNRVIAIGAVVLAFKTAQKYWCPLMRPIPKPEFDKLPNASDLILSGLVELQENGDFVYIKGTKEQFAWLVQKCEAGRNGGLARQRNHSGISLAASSGVKRRSSGVNPLPLPPTLTLTLNNTILPDLKNPSIVSFDFESLYKQFPRKEGKHRGILTCKAQIKNSKDYVLLESAIKRYSEFVAKTASDPKYIKHFSTFMNSWRDWADPETGTTNLETIKNQKLMEMLK